jgi:phage portal protein BeeE
LAQVQPGRADYRDVPNSYFRRGAERLHCEQRQDRGGYTLTLSTPGGASITQRFPDAASLGNRRAALERMLTSAGWTTDAPVRRRR